MPIKIKVVSKVPLMISAFLFLLSCGKSNQKVDRDAINSGDVTEIRLPSIQCNTCKRHITEALEKVEGIEEITIDVADKIAYVKFNKSKINLLNIENAITAVGYDADDKKADPVAYENIEQCCKMSKDDETK